MKTYSIQIADGKRLCSYKVDAETEQEAKERFMHYMSLLCAIICEEIKAEIDDMPTP